MSKVLYLILEIYFINYINICAYMHSIRREIVMKEYAEIFRALGDKTRLRILYLLLTAEKELCVCELTDSLLW